MPPERGWEEELWSVRYAWRGVKEERPAPPSWKTPSGRRPAKELTTSSLSWIPRPRIISLFIGPGE